MRLVILALSSGILLFTGCAHLAEKSTHDSKVEIEKASLQQRENHLKQAVQNLTQDSSVFDVAFDDLNQDAQDDAIVVLKGRDWCGSGGCTMLIFKGMPDQQYAFVSKTTLVDTPIYSSNSIHQGWKQLLVYSRKHGQVMLTFDGQVYPLNPSLLPVLTEKPDAKQVKLLLGQAN